MIAHQTCFAPRKIASAASESTYVGCIFKTLSFQILKINPKTGKPYANLKFMELVQIIDDVRLNDNNNDIKKAIDTIIMNDPFIFNILHNKIKITI